MLKVVIVNFNTQELTDCTIKCVNKHTPNCHIYIFDNSDKTPFVNTHKNVSVIDNTKKQILDIDKFLEQYPNRSKSPGYLGGKCISARHCITIDKCFDVIDDNFVLLDSDVIVKKDLNELVDEGCIFVGDLESHPLNNSIKRLLPFVCWINVKMCKKHGIRYFDDNYMHGLYNNKKNPDSDRYDTGGGFYMNAKAYKHKLINHKDYIIHYKGGSWDDRASRSIYKNGTPEEFIKRYRIYWDTSYKKVIYTCISGPYDRLRNPKYIDSDCDYICFTDQYFDTDKWNLLPIPKELSGFSEVKRQRALKILAHKYLSNYEVSVWVDANIDINSSVSGFITKNQEQGKYLLVGQHPDRNCIYDEEKEIIRAKKDIKEVTNIQVEKYRSEGMPEKFGLPQTCIIIRWHNDPMCVKFEDMWWNEVSRHSHRDQLSFSYVMWKLGKDGVKFLDKNIYQSNVFYRWFVHFPDSKSKNERQKYVEGNASEENAITELRKPGNLVETIRRIQRRIPSNDIYRP